MVDAAEAEAVASSEAAVAALLASDFLPALPVLSGLVLNELAGSIREDALAGPVSERRKREGRMRQENRWRGLRQAMRM